MKKIFKQKKGITLIALVITIIVLLILAGISISMLAGNNSILQKATDAKTETEKGQEKETIALAYNSALTKKVSNGNSSAVTSSELNSELDSSEAIAKNDNPITVTFVNSKRQYTINSNGIINFVGIKNDSSQEEIQEIVNNGNKIAVLNKDGELSYINFEEPDSSQIKEIDFSEKTFINTNVKELFSGGSYLTNNGELYILADDGQYYKKADNVKKIYPDKEMAYISTENELFFFDWSNPVTANYEKHAENVKEFFGNYSYSMLDGTSKIRLDRDGTFITIEEDIRDFHNGYYITSYNFLYKENTSVKGEFIKVAENVKDFSWDEYLSNNGELFKRNNGTFSKVTENVKIWYQGTYVNSSNELFNYDGSTYNKIAENVKDVGKQGYITLSNQVFIKDENDNYIDSGYQILQYGIKNNLWFKTTDDKIYYYVENGYT